MQIDWAYLRKGWNSCKNAQEFLDVRQIKINHIVEARKEKFNRDAAWELIHTAKTITTAKGKKINQWNTQKNDKETILKHVMGPSGNLRAPTLKLNDRFIIGFNAELYQISFT